MSATPSPSPSSTTSPGTVSTVVHSVWTGVWAAVTSSPLVGVALCALAAVVLAGAARALMYGGRARDPVRRFSRADKAIILDRAGYRCERHRWLFGRCRQTQDLEADHVHPWSRGGQTAVGNGQALCREHNRLKRARVPYSWQLRALAKRRAGYFPPDVSGAVVRQRARSSAKRA